MVARSPSIVSLVRALLSGNATTKARRREEERNHHAPTFNATFRRARGHHSPGHRLLHHGPSRARTGPYLVRRFLVSSSCRRVFVAKCVFFGGLVTYLRC